MIQFLLPKEGSRMEADVNYVMLEKMGKVLLTFCLIVIVVFYFFNSEKNMNCL